MFAMHFAELTWPLTPTSKQWNLINISLTRLVLFLHSEYYRMYTVLIWLIATPLRHVVDCADYLMAPAHITKCLAFSRRYHTLFRVRIINASASNALLFGCHGFIIRIFATSVITCSPDIFSAYFISFRRRHRHTPRVSAHTVSISSPIIMCRRNEAAECRSAAI